MKLETQFLSRLVMVLIASVLICLMGCEGGGGGSSTDPIESVGTVDYVDEGSLGSPFDITALTPYKGQVSKDGTSYYRITGVTPDEVYTITLARSDSLPYQEVPNAAANGSIACGWDNDTLGAVIDCSMQSTAVGVLDFSVNGDDSVGGAYEISYTQGGITNEGSPGTPVEVNTFPFSGGALIQSYYLLSGLNPGVGYACQFTDTSGPVTLAIFPDETYQSQPSICMVANGAGESCNIVADGSGNIYLLTNAGPDQNGVSYTISVIQTGVANEGSRNEPIDITSQLPYSGMVHLESSWYILNGLTAGSPYTVTLSNASDSANLYLWGPGFDVDRYDSYFYWNNGGGNPIDCVSVANTAGEIRVEVRGFDTSDGATFDLDMAAGGIPNEGYYGAPVDITGVTPWSGTVYHEGSRYKITGMADSTDYTVKISSLTDDLTLYVYDDETNNTHLCWSHNLGTVDESCVVQTTTGEFYIRVSANILVKGATFLLDVTQ